ncbi:MAG: hypothetical protein LBU65_16465 [Planctomycetaceae bacterium]|nr:hypothetical protein [Planctomycetaceae bacterium]
MIHHKNKNVNVGCVRRDGENHYSVSRVVGKMTAFTPPCATNRFRDSIDYSLILL